MRDYQYARAVSELAKRHFGLVDAYKELLASFPPIETQEGHFAHPFVERFEAYCEMIL